MVLLSGCSQSDGNSTSKEVKADQEVTVINGHTLPPEPDPDINNATLLGVDSNDNGVRDDVEWWIYKRYNTHIPCKMVEDLYLQFKGGSTSSFPSLQPFFNILFFESYSLAEFIVWDEVGMSPLVECATTHMQ